MFVRIVGTDRIYTKTFQCARVEVKPCPGKQGSHMMLEMEGLPDVIGPLSAVIDMATTEVYFMNDNGQTIDSYRWPEKRMSQYAPET